MDHVFRRRVTSCLAVSLAGVSHGAMLSWPAEVLPQLARPESSLGWLDENTQSWVASIHLLGCMAGSLCAAPLLKVVPHTLLITITALCTSLSWVMVGLAGSSITLCISRVCLGTGNSLLMTTAPSYVSTVAPSKCRGALSSCYNILVGFGLIYSVAAGVTISWSLLSLIASTPTFVLLIYSPFLYNSSKSSRSEYYSEITSKTSQNEAPKVDRPLLLFTYLVIMFVLSGVCPLGTFAEQLFPNDKTFQVSNLVLVSLVCQIVGGVLGAVAMEKVGRKPVLRAGAWLCVLSNILLSLYFSLVTDTHNCPAKPGSSLCWAPAVATCTFFFGFGGGLGNIFFVLLGELVPADSRTTIVPLVIFFLNIFQFLVIKTFLFIANVVPVSRLFFIQAGINIFFLFGQAAWIPETKPCSESLNNESYGTFTNTGIVDQAAKRLPVQPRRRNSYFV